MEGNKNYGINCDVLDQNYTDKPVFNFVVARRACKERSCKQKNLEKICYRRKHHS
jgi:hypothetical protein